MFLRLPSMSFSCPQDSANQKTWTQSINICIYVRHTPIQRNHHARTHTLSPPNKTTKQNACFFTSVLQPKRKRKTNIGPFFTLFFLSIFMDRLKITYGLFHLDQVWNFIPYPNNGEFTRYSSHWRSHKTQIRKKKQSVNHPRELHGGQGFKKIPIKYSTYPSTKRSEPVVNAEASLAR